MMESLFTSGWNTAVYLFVSLRFRGIFVVALLLSNENMARQSTVDRLWGLMCSFSVFVSTVLCSIAKHFEIVPVTLTSSE